MKTHEICCTTTTVVEHTVMIHSNDATILPRHALLRRQNLSEDRATCDELRFADHKEADPHETNEATFGSTSLLHTTRRTAVGILARL